MNKKLLTLKDERLEQKKLRKLVEEAKEILQKIPHEEIVKAIREDRDTR